MRKVIATLFMTLDGVVEAPERWCARLPIASCTTCSRDGPPSRT
jgi:hypothetical protein